MKVTDKILARTCLIIIGVILGIAWPPLFGIAFIGYLAYVAFRK